MKNDDDKDQSLRELSEGSGSSIISQLVDIGSKNNQQKHDKFLHFIKDLQCLQPKGRQLRRTSINAFREGQYVALSYTWQPSEFEDAYSGRYFVEGWDDHLQKPSAVRNCVFDRVLSYMSYAKVQFLWIDAHCIYQDTCGVAACTSHDRCIQKRDALQAMDLVYQYSEHPIALLARPLHSQSELDLLARILSGSLVDGDNCTFQLSRATKIHKAKQALRLLREITRDVWWGRAWTFQENYRGGKRMRLLIRHDQSLERRKLGHQIFDKIPGELCIRSVTFATQATRLCLALKRVKLPQDDCCRIEDVLRAAGRYKVMLPKSSAMTPRVISDIEDRGLSKPWDRLAIVANCCQYPVRLHYEALSKQRHSLSLSVLAMCLLNGEILDNSDSSLEPMASLTMSQFLERKLFKAFRAPEDDFRPLTFNKGCRLTNVKLTADGILAKGHLWKLGRIIDTKTWTLPWMDNPSGRLRLMQRKHLLQLFSYLNDELDHPLLANRIKEYLADDAKSHAKKGFSSFTEMYLHHMAIELARAIKERRKLRLGSIWEPAGQTKPYRAIFVWSDKEEDEAHPPPAFVFTSAWYRDGSSKTHDANDIDHHVSLEVSREESPGNDGVQHLRVRKWLLGMCFFKGCPRTEVVFPWPRALQAVNP